MTSVRHRSPDSVGALPVCDGAPLPAGFRVQLSGRAHVCDDGATVVDASGGRVLHLAPAAARLVAAGEVVTGAPVATHVAQRLVDTGIGIPTWIGARPGAEDDAAVDDVTVVIPVYGAPAGLATLLAALPPGLPVVVVDDGSNHADARTIAAVAADRGARVLRLAANRGPAAARNAGLANAGTEFVAFLDCDVRPDPGWLAVLHRHFADPQVAVVAPRVLAQDQAGDRSWLARYEQARSSLDMGNQPALVRPRTPVAYVPSACLVVRRACVGDGFDPALRSGEDVDLVWRLSSAGWRVRYEPAATVRHRHRDRLMPWLRRKAFYGTSAADLAARHGDAVAPLVIAPWSAVVTIAVLAQRRWSVPVAAAVVGMTIVRQARVLRRAGRPWAAAATVTAEGTVATIWQTGSALTRHYWPLAAAACLFSRRARRAVLVAAVADAVADYRRLRPDLDPVRFALARRLDDLAYGAGLWRGVLRRRSVRALLPAATGLRRRQR